MDGGNRGYFSEQLGFGFRDMNELICAADKDPELLKKIAKAAEAAGVRGYLYTGGSLLEYVKSIVHDCEQHGIP